MEIRNFSIIAHIDHGKSTLADRLLEKSGLIRDAEVSEQMLDSMEVEKEHGITVKAQTVSVPYKAKDGKEYLLNLIDTPGHVDFSYEVSRSLAACEGVLLLIDATQGIQAQTLSHFYQAVEMNLEIIPVINKVDLASAEVDEVKEQIENDLGLDASESVLISAKTGLGIDELLEKIVEKIPAPERKIENTSLKALVYDAYYDSYRGVIVKVRIFEGELKAGDKILFMRKNKEYAVEEVGYMQLLHKKQKSLKAGDVGYVMAAIKQISDITPGDTVTIKEKPCKELLEGYKEPKAYVFSGVFPSDGENFGDLNEALEKLKLNDASLQFEKWRSAALGMGFKCGFLGLLHLEIIQERLEKEFDLNIVSTIPSVEYEIHMADKSIVKIESATELPRVNAIDYIAEPYVLAVIITPAEFMGGILNLIQERRGIQKDLTYIDQKRIQIKLELPLAEIVYDFYDRLKSISRGFASFDYEFLEFRRNNIVKMDILVSGEVVDALSQMIYAKNTEKRGRSIVKRLRELIPRHQFQISLQAAVGGKIVARENISAYRKDVTAKCYGGDITRKRKLLEKQKEGKKKMKSIGNVQIPQEAFISILKRGENE